MVFYQKSLASVFFQDPFGYCEVSNDCLLANDRFVPHESGSETRQARVQTLEPNQWMKEANV